MSSVARDQDRVFNAHAAEIAKVNARLVGDNHIRQKVFAFAKLAKARLFMNLKLDAVSQAA